MISTVWGWPLLTTPKTFTLSLRGTRPFDLSPLHPARLSSGRSTPETLMLDVAYLAGLLIAYGLFYGFSYVCSRL